MIDQYDGQGGSYIADPKTGARTLIERTSEIAEPTASAPAPAPALADAPVPADEPAELE